MSVPPRGRGLRSQLRHREGRGRVREAHGLQQGTALDEGHRQRAAVDVARRRRVHGLDREAGHEGAHAVPGHVGPARAERQHDRLRPLRQERGGRRLDVALARHLQAGQELGLGLVDREVREPRERRVGHRTGRGEVEHHGLAELRPEGDRAVERLRQDLALADHDRSPLDRLAGAVHVRGGEAVVRPRRHRQVVLALAADHDERGPRRDARLARDEAGVDPVLSQALDRPGRRTRRRPRRRRRRRRLLPGPRPPPGWLPCRPSTWAKRQSVTVSPTFGRRGIFMSRSTFELPTTTTLPFICRLPPVAVRDPATLRRAGPR